MQLQAPAAADERRRTADEEADRLLSAAQQAAEATTAEEVRRRLDQAADAAIDILERAGVEAAAEAGGEREAAAADARRILEVARAEGTRLVDELRRAGEDDRAALLTRSRAEVEQYRLEAEAESGLASARILRTAEVDALSLVEAAQAECARMSVNVRRALDATLTRESQARAEAVQHPQKGRGRGRADHVGGRRTSAHGSRGCREGGPPPGRSSRNGGTTGRHPRDRSQRGGAAHRPGAGQGTRSPTATR